MQQEQLISQTKPMTNGLIFGKVTQMVKVSCTATWRADHIFRWKYEAETLFCTEKMHKNAVKLKKMKNVNCVILYQVSS